LKLSSHKDAAISLYYDVASQVGGATTLNIMTFNITTFSIMTISLKGLFATLSLNDTLHNDIQHCDNKPKGFICDTA
jgi:hypothetical protein